MRGIFFILISAAALLLSGRLFEPAAPFVETAHQVPLPSRPSEASIPRSPTPAKAVPSLHKPVENLPAIPSRPDVAWEPTAQQKHRLDEAHKDEEDWEKQREQFLDSDLKLSESEQSSLSTLRQATATQEAHLMTLPARGVDEESAIAAQLRANRLSYEEKIRAALGQSRYEALATFYRDEWKSDGLGAHLPLK